MSDEAGYAKGELCNRDGCQGILDEHDSDYGCSCHINPPCSYCTSAREYCPECGWDGSEEQIEGNKAYEASPAQVAQWAIEQAKWKEREDKFWSRYRSNELVTKFEKRIETHSNASQKVTGMYPLGMPRVELMSHINGSWGGRFEYHDPETGRFIFIAYTD